jgi:hypothetical protein
VGIGGQFRCCFTVPAAADGIFRANSIALLSLEISQMDQSIAIVVEPAQNLNRANFPLKSKAKKSDGLWIGV